MIENFIAIIALLSIVIICVFLLVRININYSQVQATVIDFKRKTGANSKGIITYSVQYKYEAQENGEDLTYISKAISFVKPKCESRVKVYIKKDDAQKVIPYNYVVLLITLIIILLLAIIGIWII